ncbi:hypothetical protein INT45_004225 [Circinella minor]|uniref:Uncharacterized protein n=1 Tax=Circinella minor TaxID=1195481 RepID=A0A8H7RTR5_9FUNG|nr:hypothetical protein INT45_004225 [Circinella minor]
MLDNNSKTLSTNGKRPPLRLKKIFCPSMHHRTSKDSHLQEMAISPPLMSPPQPMIHSNNRIYSLVSPTRPTHPSLFMGSGGDNDHDDSVNNQNKRPPVLNSVPPRVSSMPKHRVPRRSTIGTPSNISLHQNKTSMASPPEPPKKSPSRPSKLPRPSVSSRATAPPPPSSKKSSGVSSGAGDRRHSFHVPPLQQSSSLLSSINSVSVSSISAEQGHSRLAELASNSSKSASTSSTTLASFSSSSSSSSSTKKKKRNRQSRAAAAATMPPPQPTLQKSRSTPLRRIKEYNVDYDHQSQMERKRKQRELEELIAGGRRGSTLKLSLTPRGL